MRLFGDGMMITFTQVAADLEDEFNEWYNREHLDERIHLPGFRRARRYEGIDAEIKYMSTYACALPSDIGSPTYLDVLSRPSGWSNGFVRATPHRVIPPVENDRYSLAFFVCPNLDAVGECLPSCQTPDNPPKYDPESFWQFHTGYMSRVYPHFEERWENEQPPTKNPRRP